MKPGEIEDIVLQFNNKRKTNKGRWLFFDCSTTIGVLQIKSFAILRRKRVIEVTGDQFRWQT